MPTMPEVRTPSARPGRRGVITSAAIPVRRAASSDAAARAAIVNDWIDDTGWMPRNHAPGTKAGHLADGIADPEHGILVASDPVAGYPSFGRADALIRGFCVGQRDRGAGEIRMERRR